jgi:hypothetical protein
MSKPKLYFPVNQTGRFNHSNSSSREIFLEWARRGYVELIESTNGFVWLNKIGDVLLHDQPTLEWLAERPQKFNIALFGNLVPKDKNIFSWFFWGRHPLKLEKKAEKYLGYDERQFESMFIGKIENHIQAKFRQGNLWEKYIEFFDLITDDPRNSYKFTQDEYLDVMANSKYGLSLRGYGPKCNREIELLALGTVPLVATECDMENYNEPLIEGKHYIRIEKPEHIPIIINNTSKEDWERISNAGREWYFRNCSIDGSFQLTMNIINKQKHIQ